jgi:hypothetical protein
MFFDDIPQTMKCVYQEICQGKREWTALGNFMNDWYSNYKHKRWSLVKEPIELPENPTPEQIRWAVFCAASVDYFCKKYHVRRPAWVNTPLLKRLPEPWYFSAFADREEEREQLRQEAPEPFASRNIFCSRRIYANKWEIAEDLASRRSA